MADRKVQYALGFTADTAKAKAQIKDLQNQLNDLANTALNRNDLDYSGQIGKSIKAVNQLQNALQQATNAKTGKLDLSKFNDSLSKSGLHLKDIQQNLVTLGPKGQQAFLSLTQSIVTADASLVKTSKLLQDMKTSLANTVKWQISSSAIHAFMGAVQGAYGYAQDLNESLNNIRIVTGQSTDQMAKFAKQANNVAKALSTTTVEYTDAALIYYQQGLPEEQVQERAAVTAKLANVSRQSAEVVSDQMTSVWNNFYNGSKSLEYYADVMTKLGAATASSSDEIATGLEKFAAVSNTVGLSYEYAAAALATVTAQTRQSADTVGTAFRTLFTRLEGLQLGEAADDGTTLNKYSQALETVGVNIKNSNGELKDMDTILDDLGSKWNAISKEQQVALAQTVGGARQYATLIALMDNWSFFKTNLSTAYGSSGALEEQQQIYSESWEAARDRVTAALEDIYDSLLDDEFFIGLTDVFADLLEYIGNFIDSLGGMKGIISLLGVLITNIFGKEIKTAFSIAGSWIDRLTGKTKKEINEMRNASVKLTQDMARSMGQTVQAGVLSRTSELYGEIGKKIALLNDDQKKELENALEINRVLRERTLLMDEESKKEEKKLQNSLREMRTSSQVKSETKEDIMNRIPSAKAEGATQGLTQYLSQNIKNFVPNQGEEFKKRVEEIQGYLEELKGKGAEVAEEVQKAVDEANEQLEKLGKDDLKDAGKIEEIQKNLNDSLNKVNQTIDLKYEEIETKLKADYGDDLGQQIFSILQHALNIGNAEVEKQIAVLNEKTANAQIKNWLNGLTQSVTNFGTMAMASAKALSGFVTVVNTIKGSLETVMDPDLSGWEKFTAIIGAASSVMMTLKFAFDAATVSQLKNIGFSIGLSIAKIAEAKGWTIAYKAALKYSAAMAGATGASAGILVPILAVVAVLGVLFLAIKKVYEFLNKEEIALKKANEELKVAKTAAEEAANAYSDLKSAIEELNGAESSLYGLTKGTLEWQYAVEELNAKALELIKTYGLIQGIDWDYNQDGVIELYQSGKDKMISERVEGQRNANAYLNIKTSEQTKMQRDYERNLIAKDLGSNGDIVTDDYLEDLVKRGEVKEFDTSVYSNWDDIVEYVNQIKQDRLLENSTTQTYLRGNKDLNNLIKNANFTEDQEKYFYESLAEGVNNKDFTIDEVSDKEFYEWGKTQGYDEYKDGTFYKDGEKVEDIDLEGVKETINFLKYIKKIGTDKDLVGEFVSDTLQYDFTKNPMPRTIEDVNAEEVQRASNIRASFSKEDQENLTNYIEHLQDVVESLEDNEEMAERIAAANMNYNDGLQDLMDNFEEYQEMLSDGEGTENYSKALNAIKDDMSKILDIDASALSEGFFTSAKNLELMKQAAEGNTDAILKLKEAAGKDIIANIEWNTEELKGEALTYLTNLQSFIDSEELSKLKLGMTLDDSGMTEALNYMVQNTEMSVKDAQAYLDSIGFEPVVDYEEVDLSEYQEQHQGSTIEIFDPSTNSIKEISMENATKYAVGGKIKIPKINGSKTTYRGNPGEITTAKKVSKGGGSSKKDKKSSSKEIERYHVISNEMEEIQNELDKISTATERAFGADKLALIDDEIQKMRELKDAQDEYVRQIEENFEKDKQAIAAYGAVFDKDGTILNYEEIMQRQIDKFNASRTDAAEEEYQKFLDLLKQYEETNDLLDKERNESIKQAGELLDKELEDVEHRVNLQVEFNDDTIEYLEFLLEQLEDQAFSAAESIDLLSRQVKENFDNIKSNSSGLAETLALAGFDSETIDGVLTGDQAAINKMMSQKGIDNNIIESVKEYRDALMGSMSSVRDLQKAIDEELINSLDEASEKFGELHDELNHNADILSSLQNIMDLTGESILGFTDDAKKAIEDAQLDTAISQVATSYDKLTAAQEEYKKAVESDQSEEVIKAAAEKVKEAEEQLLSDWEAALEQATTNFEASIERSVAAFSNAVAGAYGGLDELQDAFDKQEELDDIYIEDYKKIYELTKLSRDISRSIDDSDNIKAKQALRDLQGEINELQKEGVELSEYDIEYLQKKYELRLAEIALEEAQNAKSTVRMTRDSEGNWSYTYTADQDDINEAQQNYEDKLYAIQELSDNYIKDMQSQVLDLLSAYEDEMAKINFSEEGWEQKAKEIEAFYQAKFNLLAQQFEGALGNQSDIYGEWEDYSALTGYGISANQDFIDSFDETTLSQLTGFQTMAEYQQVFTTNSQKLLTDLSGSFMDWRDHVQRIYEQAGKSTEDFAEKVGDMAEGVKEDNQSVVDSSESLKNEVIDNFEEAANGASAFADTWNEKIKTMTDSNNDLVESINDIIEAWARLNNAEEEKNNKQEQNEQEEKDDSSNNNNNNNKTLSENDSVSVKTSATHFATGQQMAGFVPGGSYSVMQVSGDRVLIGRNGVATGWVKKTDLVGFHSGGYTGEWGSSGKLAMLHEKELVLNANDTKNILTSVELMREISQAIDLNASMSAYSNAISAAMPNTGVITNQNIVINAEFPDATDRLEIQAAFDNLLNRASQYANRK